MIGPIASYRADPDDFTRNLWANVVGSAVVIAVVVVLILATRARRPTPGIVGAVIEAS